MTMEALPELPRRQSEVLSFLLEYQRRQGYGPSMDEIGLALGIASTSTTAYHLDALARKGYIRRRGPRSFSFHESLTQPQSQELCPHCGK